MKIFFYDAERSGLQKLFDKIIPSGEIIDSPFKPKEDQQDCLSGVPQEELDMNTLSIEQLLYIYDHVLDKLDNKRLNLVLNHITLRVNRLL